MRYRRSRGRGRFRRGRHGRRSRGGRNRMLRVGYRM